MKILVTVAKGELHDVLFAPGYVQRLSALGQVMWNETERNWTTEELRDRLPGVDAAISCWGTPCFSEEALANADRLRFIGHAAGSVANIASAAAYDRGITVVSANDHMAKGVAEWNLCAMLMGRRQLWRWVDRVRSGGWIQRDERQKKVLRVDGCTVGIIGYGAIARELIRLMEPFQCRILVHTRYLTKKEAAARGLELASLETLLKESDVIHLLTSLRRDTYQMINATNLPLIRDGAVFINSGRGKIVDQAALIEELKKDRFVAVLDVYVKEPLPDGSRLRTLPNVFATPHVGGSGGEPRYVDVVVTNLEQFVRGETPANLVTRQQWENMTDQTVGR